MRRDPTEFRQRFAAWKDGENYWDTRGENMLPGYSGGKTKKDSAYVSPQAQQAVRYFMSKGLTDFQAAGLVGNLMRESGMNHRSKNSGSGAYGLAQWLGSRKKALFNKYGNNPSFQNQLDFIWHELNTSHKSGLKYLRRSKTAEEAARNAMGYYEFSAGPEGAIAEMNKYGQDGRRSMREGITNATRLIGQPIPSRGPLKPTLISTQPVVERLKENELPLQLPNQQPIVQMEPQPMNTLQQTQNVLAQNDYWDGFFNNSSLDQLQSLMQQQMTSHKHGKNILPRHKDGKTSGEYNEELVELPEVRVDDEGNVVNNGRKGSVRLPEVVVKPDHNVREAVDRYYDKLSRRSERAWYTNPITGESYMPKGGPLESVYPEFDLITLGQMSAPILKAAGKKFVQNRSYSLGRPTVPHEFSKPSPNKISIREEGVIQPKYSDLLEQKSLGTYLDEGGESTVFENIRFPNKVIKEKEGLQSVQNFEELEERIGKDLLQNKLPNTLPLKYEGYTHEPVFRKVKTGKGTILKQHFDIFKPVYSQKRITPADKIADPWHTVRKEGSVWEPSNDWYRQLEYLGYNRTSDGFYKVSGFPYKVGDLGPSNVGFDDFGNMLVFDPLIHYKHGKNPIHINPANRGKFNALKKRTGKTTEQLTHSKNPLTRKRAIFAQNAAKWRRK